MALGAAVDCMDEAWWVVTSLGPERDLAAKARYAADGTPLPFMHHLDLSLPYSMMVDQLGERFCDEAGAYMEIGQRMYQRHAETGKAVPSWVIMDSRQRENYPWGTRAARPDAAAVARQRLHDPGRARSRSWRRSAASTRAGSSARSSASTASAEPASITISVAAVARFRSRHGDPTVKPNPNLGAIEQPPFYAVRMYPGDVGTAGGIVTDEHARVLRDDGSVIAGPLRHRQLHRIGGGPLLSRRRREHRRLVRLRLHRRAACGAAGRSTPQHVPAHAAGATA